MLSSSQSKKGITELCKWWAFPHIAWNASLALALSLSLSLSLSLPLSLPLSLSLSVSPSLSRSLSLPLSLPLSLGLSLSRSLSLSLSISLALSLSVSLSSLSLSSCTYTFYLGFKQRIFAHMETGANWKQKFEMTIRKTWTELNWLNELKHVLNLNSPKLY